MKKNKWCRSAEKSHDMLISGIKQRSLFVLLSLNLLFASCEQEKDVRIQIDSPEGLTGNISLVASVTDEVLAALPVEPSEGKVLPLEEATTGSLRLGNREEGYLVTLYPGKLLQLNIKADSSISTNSKGDSLLNYLWKSNNSFVRKNQGIIFGEPDSLLAAFSRFRKTRDRIIESAKLSEVETALLKFQNKARINSFLFYAGRQMRNFPPDHSFFDFAGEIDLNSTGLKSLPDNVLYKYELDYLNTRGDIVSIADFNDFIGEKTQDKDLADFLKAYYLSNLILNSSYWTRHAPLFNSEVLREEMEREKGNQYYHLFDRSARRVFSSMAGVEAFNFTAEKLDGSSFQLSDLSEKVVFIDSWATWCAPCIGHRPKVLELAGKYKDDPRVQVLMVSVDEDREAWRRFLASRGSEEDHGLDLHIEGGFDSEYRTRYNVNFIPKYILIGKDGRIIKADITEPSLGVVQMIEEALKS